MRPQARRSASGTFAALALLCLLASCGTSSPPSPTSPAVTTAPTTTAPTTSTSTSACADVSALRSSLEALTKVKPAKDGVAALTTAMDEVKVNLAKARASATAALQSQVRQTNAAFTELQTAVTGLTAQNLKEKAPAINAALTQVKTATEALASTLTQGCPGS